LVPLRGRTEARTAVVSYGSLPVVEDERLCISFKSTKVVTKNQEKKKRKEKKKKSRKTTNMLERVWLGGVAKEGQAGLSIQAERAPLLRLFSTSDPASVPFSHSDADAPINNPSVVGPQRGGICQDSYPDMLI
jgi:hypothetical protein